MEHLNTPYGAFLCMIKDVIVQGNALFVQLAERYFTLTLVLERFSQNKAHSSTHQPIKLGLAIKTTVASPQESVQLLHKSPLLRIRGDRQY